jgi:hypothetical protein
VGSKAFVEKTKEELGYGGPKRDESFGKRGHMSLGSSRHTIISNFGAEIDDLGLQNLYFWDIFPEISKR